MNTEELLTSTLITMDEALVAEYEKAKELIDDYYGDWYSRNDNTEDLKQKGHLMPVIRKTTDKKTGEVNQIVIYWNCGGVPVKEGRHKFANLEFLKKGKGFRYSDSTFKRRSKLDWEKGMVCELEDHLAKTREVINSITRAKKNTKIAIKKVEK